ncbi:MAG: GNAT family N-acetyltransferase [Methylobacteriaceae bacterium]|nr:GNAT family N-acetyltransferase [Methylobacteriaceae bacterium]
MASSFGHARPVPLWLNTATDSRTVGDRSRPQQRSGGAVPGPARSPFVIEAFGFETAAEICDEWADLVSRSLEPNVFMEPGFALAAAQHLARADRPTFVAVWQRESSDDRGRLLALWALVLPRTFFGSQIATLWCHKQSALGLPVLDAARANELIAAVFVWLADAFPRVRILVFPKLVRSGPTFARILAYALATGLEWRLLDQHERPILLANGAGVNISNEGYRSLARRRRQLEKYGKVLVRSSRDPAEIRNAAEAFLALEESGWKGRRRTALLCDSSRAAFARTMTRRLSREGKCRIDALTIDGRPIAMGIILRTRDRASFWKIAYDEAFAAQSPGVQLALETTQIQMSDEACSATDSCSAPGNGMIERLWRDRLPIVDLALPLYPAANEMLGGFAWRNVLRRRLRRRLSRWVRERIRREHRKTES